MEANVCKKCIPTRVNRLGTTKFMILYQNEAQVYFLFFIPRFFFESKMLQYDEEESSHVRELKDGNTCKY